MHTRKFMATYMRTHARVRKYIYKRTLCPHAIHTHTHTHTQTHTHTEREREREGERERDSNM